MHKLIYLPILIVLLNYPIQSAIEAAASGFSIDLIHHDSPLSPYYNSSLTPSQILRQFALRSKARVDYFNSIQAEKTARSTVHPTTGEYMMNLSFGTPPVSFLAVADTGSDLIWVKCSGQDCFNPQGSSSYGQVPCSSNSCQLLQPSSRSCGTGNNSCLYNYAYGSGAAEGVLSSDTISLDSTSGQPVGFPASVFGCTSSFGTDITISLGGLGGGPLSLISQLGDKIDHKLAYCLLPYNSNSTSTLKFGQDAVISGSGVVSTPLITDPNNPTYYYLTLNGISVGQSSIQTPQNKSKIIIDSGTSFTFLEPSFYSELEAMVINAFGEPAQKSDLLCYAAISISDVPDMVFHFDGGDLTLTGANTFINGGTGMSCMSIRPSPESLGLSIFGNMAQINFQVEYDLQGKKVCFAPADCTKN